MLSRMLSTALVRWASAACAALALVLPAPVSAQVSAEAEKAREMSRRGESTMANPYRLTRDWPTIPNDQEWGAAIGLLPDDTGGLWMLFRSDPPIVYVNADGQFTKRFGEGMIVQAHGFCMDHDGNLWAGDSGPFGDDPSTRGRGFQIHKFSQDGELLMSLGEAGVSRADRADTFIGPTACTVASNGNIVIADGHWPRPSNAQQDGDRLVEVTPDGAFVREAGRMGAGPGEFMGPHSLAFDAEQRLFVADRSNNRVQILDRDFNFIDAWTHFGRPSGVWVTASGMLIVSDSESGGNPSPPQAVEYPVGVRNPGVQVGIRVGYASDGSLHYFIPGTRPEGLAADNLGNIFGGLTGGCDESPSGGCLQKYVRVVR